MYKNTTGSYNTAYGRQALYSNTTGADNLALGNRALYLNTSGVYNVAMGTEALRSNTTGGSNVAVGRRAGYLLNDGSNNAFIGTGACNDITSANNFFCFGNSVGTIFTANTSTGHMVLGNGNGQITIDGDLYVTGTIYNANGSISSSGQDTSVDQGSEIQGSNEFILPSSKNSSGSLNEDDGNNFSVAQLNNESNNDTSNSENEEGDQEVLFSYSPPKRILDSNVNIKQKALNGERLDDIDVRISKIDESIIGLNNQLDILDGRLSTLERSFTEQIIAMEDGFAMSAALASRPTPRTMGWNLTYGMGNYASSNAVSIGFVYVGEEHIFSVGYAEADGSGKSMINIGGSIPLNNIFRK